MSLKEEIFISPPIPWLKPSGAKGGLWSPISSTLIHGPHTAVLVDTAITDSQNLNLIDWIQKTIPGKKLAKIYITHGHGDHFFGIPLLIEKFPGVEVWATRGTKEHMREQAQDKTFQKTWGSQFAGQISYREKDVDDVKVLPEDGELEIDGFKMKAVEVGQADTHSSTVLWVPDLKLAVCGDVVYGNVHMMLGECDTYAKRQAWIKAIKIVGALGPEKVVSGHMMEEDGLGTKHLWESMRYIEVFEECLVGAKNAREVGKKMLERYGGRFNEGALYVGCMNAVKKGEKL